MIIGLDYHYLFSYKNYKQAIFQIVKRANALKLQTIYLGFTANIEKHKYGAEAIPKIAYIQTNDTFNMEILEATQIHTQRKKTIDHYQNTTSSTQNRQ